MSLKTEYNTHLSRGLRAAIVQKPGFFSLVDNGAKCESGNSSRF
jgi:hypothetical protein